MSTDLPTGEHPAAVALFWLPLGVGDNTHLVTVSGRIYEAVTARRDGRTPVPLFHSALQVRLGSRTWCIEMAPVWSERVPPSSVIGTGPVGVGGLGRWRLFRYEVRCWEGGRIPDLAWAVESPVPVSADPAIAVRTLVVIRDFPLATWGRDVFGVGEMWNSNSLTSWLLERSGAGSAGIRPPCGGRAPGWGAGVAVARRARLAVG